MLVALAVIAGGRVKVGGLVLALSLGLGALLRAVVPTRGVGGLAVRSRAFDTITLLVLAVACILLAVVLKST
jgi:hypothetical protein